MPRQTNEFRLAFVLCLALSAASVFAAKNKTPPDLMKACAKECPNMTTNDQVLQCIDRMETDLGEKTFKKKHKSCYKAHEKYEKMTGKEEAGEHEESHE